jgi:hypothetical protein
MSSISQFGEQIAPGQWRGKLTQHVFDSPEAMVHYERQESQKALARAQQSNPLDRLSTGEIRLLTEAFCSSIAEGERQNSVSDEADAFLLRHPEFINSPVNGGKLMAVLVAQGKQHTASLTDMEDAYRILRDANSLELDQAELARQRQAAIEERANQPAHAGGYSEAELYEMPFGQLERLAKGFL